MNVESKGPSQRASSFAGNKFGSRRFHGYTQKKSVKMGGIRENLYRRITERTSE